VPFSQSKTAIYKSAQYDSQFQKFYHKYIDIFIIKINLVYLQIKIETYWKLHILSNISKMGTLVTIKGA